MSDPDFFTKREIFIVKSMFVILGVSGVGALANAMCKTPSADAWLNFAGIILATIATITAAFIALRSSGLQSKVRPTIAPSDQ